MTKIFFTQLKSPTMSLLRACFNSRQVFIPRIHHACIRFNSSAASPLAPESKSSTQKSLFTQIYPVDKDKVTEQDVDKWIDALKQLRKGKRYMRLQKKSTLDKLHNQNNLSQTSLNQHWNKLRKLIPTPTNKYL